MGVGAFNLAVVGDPLMVGINGIAGNAITMTEPEGIQFYTTESSLVSTELTETTAPLGSGGYIEVTPGTYEVEYGGAVTTCRSISAWAGSQDGSVRMPIRDGYLTFSWVSCELGLPLEAQLVSRQPPLDRERPFLRRPWPSPSRACIGRQRS